MSCLSPGLMVQAPLFTTPWSHQMYGIEYLAQIIWGGSSAFPASRTIIVQPYWIASSSSSPNEVLGPLHTTPFGTEPHVRPRL
eukprot:4853237-Pleurochrysis_carterae.AAC.1